MVNDNNKALWSAAKKLGLRPERIPRNVEGAESYNILILLLSYALFLFFILLSYVSIILLSYCCPYMQSIQF